MKARPSSGQPEIAWVGHASFLLRQGETTLWTDPWTVGRAFDNSWEQYAAPLISECDLDAVTHIWVSHEHPDHFSPATLRSIPEHLRRRITVLYTTETDGRVAATCRGLHFAAVEHLRPGAWTPLGDGMEAMCSPHRWGDSYLAVRTSAGIVLNLNDCVIDTPGEARSILRQIGVPPAVLLTQFSDANRAGNRHDASRRQVAARKSLDAMRAQVRGLRPDVVIPSASFVWFCHGENAYMNDSVNRPSLAVDTIRRDTTSTPVVLYPGDSWVISEPPPCADAATTRYDDALDRVLDAPTLSVSQLVPWPDLQESGRRFATQLVHDNGRAVVALLRASGHLGRVHVELSDTGQSLCLTASGIRQLNPRSEPDLILSSSMLRLLLDHRFGGSTLISSARFSRPRESYGDAMYRLIRLRDANNNGRGIASVAWMRIVPVVERCFPDGRIGAWTRDHRAGPIATSHGGRRRGRRRHAASVGDGGR